MEVAQRYWRAFLAVVGSFLGEAQFRCLLCLDVALGRIPVKTRKRHWNPEMERPAVIHVQDWTTERHILSVVVWPPLESEAHSALFALDRRVKQAKEVIAKGCAEQAWSTSLSVEYGLSWDPARKVWTDSSGFAYEYPERTVS